MNEFLQADADGSGMISRDEYVGMRIHIIRHAGSGQSATILAYDGISKIANITDLNIPPACDYPMAAAGGTPESRSGLWYPADEAFWLPDYSSVPGRPLDPTCSDYLVVSETLCAELARVEIKTEPPAGPGYFEFYQNYCRDNPGFPTEKSSF